ncbi:MAG: condensation domain-containing protein, partial [Pseudomonadota bacterium]|nr:condensation domain-containing protein [Pseudomonadota bacterium]
GNSREPDTVPALGEMITQLATIWEEVLNRSGIGPHDDYFDLGGDSLQAVMILARIRDVFGVDLPVSALFDFPTVARLARDVESARAEASRRVVLPLRRRTLADGMRPLSFTQELILQVSGNPLLAASSAFNRIGAIRIEGDLDRAALEIAITGIVEAHEVLRSALVYRDGVPATVLSKSGKPVLKELGGGIVSRAQARDLAITFGNRPYGLEKGNLVRFGLIRIGQAAHLLVVGAHYFVFDGWSMDVFLPELAERYAAARESRAPVIGQLNVGYADYAQWQSDLLESGALDDKLAHWKGQLAGALPHVDFDRKRWTSPDNRFELQRRVLEIPERVVEQLRKLARSSGATLNMVLLAALNVLYGTLEGQRENIMLIQSAGRSEKDTEGLIGNFVQTLPIRTLVEPDANFKSLLARVREQCLAAVANENVPFARIIQDVFAGRDMLLDPVSPLLFVFKNFRVLASNAGDVTFAPADLEYQSEVFGLIVKVHEGPGALDCGFLYNPVVVSNGEAEILARCYGVLLERIARTPEASIAALLPVSVIIRAAGVPVLAREGLRKLLRKLGSSVARS